MAMFYLLTGDFLASDGLIFEMWLGHGGSSPLMFSPAVHSFRDLLSVLSLIGYCRGSLKGGHLIGPGSRKLVLGSVGVATIGNHAPGRYPNHW
jgi:hypothetical protein